MQIGKALVVLNSCSHFSRYFSLAAAVVGRKKKGWVGHKGMKYVHYASFPGGGTPVRPTGRDQGWFLMEAKRAPSIIGGCADTVCVLLGHQTQMPDLFQLPCRVPAEAGLCALL